jgi:hypothetical protein
MRGGCKGKEGEGEERNSTGTNKWEPTVVWLGVCSATNPHSIAVRGEGRAERRSKKAPFATISLSRKTFCRQNLRSSLLAFAKSCFGIWLAYRQSHIGLVAWHRVYIGLVGVAWN